MKMKKPHEVALNKQILKALKEHKKDKISGLCFKNMRGVAFYDSAVWRMLKYTNYIDRINAHGMRDTFATIANELRAEHGFGNDIVQVCLAHETQNAVASAYKHASYKKAREELLQWWGDKLGYIDLEVLKNTSKYTYF